MSMKELKEIRNIINDVVRNLTFLVNDDDLLSKVVEAALWIIESIKGGNKLMICGNGGSAADAQHLAGEFICKFLKNRNPLPAIALTTDTSILTAISNDYSFTDIFSRQVRAMGKKGDILLGISTSGTSENVLNAFAEASIMGIRTILLTGNLGNTEIDSVLLMIKIPSCETPRVQEMHLLIEHIIAELVEQELCKDD